jgi:hypothetical protein
MAMPRVQRPTSDFRLPPEISFRKEQSSAGWIYTFRHRDLGELGRILLQDHPSGKCQVVCEIAGDPEDPMTARRKEIFGPLGIQLSQLLDIATGGRGDSGQAIDSPPQGKRPPTTYHRVLTRLEQCERCRAFLAVLALAEEARSVSELEDCARMMFSKAKEWNLPAWAIAPNAIGPARETAFGSEPTAPVLKIWPEREPLEYLTVEEFNAKLDALREAHRC